jgi:hypothetical protein
MTKRKLRPVLDGPWWLIGPSPVLEGKVDGSAAHRIDFEKGRVGEHNAPVDHHIVRDDDGAFHLWGCVRNTAIGRLLYHWETDDLTKSPWRDTGEIIRVNRDVGESIDDWFGEEWIQSPFFVHFDETYYMFYGAHRAGIDSEGRPVDVASRLAGGGTGEPGGGSGPAGPGGDRSLYQICLMTSPDGRNWTRHVDAAGMSRLFLGPGETRDPCVVRIGELWYMYYAGYFNYDAPTEGAGFVARTSDDLLHWSDWRIVHQDPQFGDRRTDAECPFVIEKEGYFYLFRTVDYYRCMTLVFRSDDPLNFGIGDAGSKFVGRLPCAAGELYSFDGQEYVSSSHTPLFGEQLCKLKWVED